MAGLETRRRFWCRAGGGIFFQGGAAAADTGTIVASLVHGLTGSPTAVGAAAAIGRYGWLFPRIFVGYFAQRRRRLPFYMLGAFGRVVCLVAVAVLIAFLGPPEPPAGFGRFLKQGVEIYRRGNRFRLFVYCRWLEGAAAMVLPFYVVRATETGFGAAEVAVLLGAQTAGAPASNPLWGWWGDRIGERALLEGVAALAGPPSSPGLACGDRPRQGTDLFHPDGDERAPLHVFLHGSYWQSMARDDFGLDGCRLQLSGHFALHRLAFQPAGHPVRLCRMPDTKLEILEAAGRVVLEQGVSSLTLETVASEAGLSKGGLLYHYATKEALLVAMVERLVEVTEERIATLRAQDSDPGSWMRGYLQACLLDERQDTDPTGRLDVAVFAASATDPHLLERLRERQQIWRRRIRDDGIDEVTALIVRLAADGLWMNDIFDLPVLNQKERRAVLRRLAALTRD